MRERYDIFVSFKNLDEHGRRTEDSELAERLYRYLSERGLKVFFSNASLEQLGAADYSKTIDDILDHATVLLAVGTSAAHLASRWVRYEWDSFSNDILAGNKPNGKVFVYTKGVRTADLPRKLRQTQCIEDGPGSEERLYNFINSALDHPGEVPAVIEASSSVAAQYGGTIASGLPVAREDRRWFGVAVLGRTEVREQIGKEALHQSERTSRSGSPVDWTVFCAELGSRVALSGYGVYGTRAMTVGEAYYRGACLALGNEETSSSVCRLMSELPFNARQRRLVRATFLRGAQVGIVVGGTMGTKEEYELMRAGGSFIIPIGASGGTAFQIWSRIIEEYVVQLKPDLLRDLEGLGDPAHTQEDHLNAVMRIVEARFRLSSAPRTP